MFAFVCLLQNVRDFSIFRKTIFLFFLAKYELTAKRKKQAEGLFRLIIKIKDFSKSVKPKNIFNGILYKEWKLFSSVITLGKRETN